MTEKDFKIINDLKADSAKREYFFRTARNPKWFWALKENGFFDVRTIPTQPSSGYVQDWDVLPYLERIASRHNEEGIETPVSGIIDVMTKATEECTKNEKKRNFRMWWLFIRILTHLGPENVPVEVLDLIPTWLEAENRQLAPGAEFVRMLAPYVCENHIRKVEKMVDYATDWHWVESKGWRDKEIDLAVQPYWLAEGLIKNGRARKIGESCEIGFIRRMAGKLQKSFPEKYHRNWVDIEDGEMVYRAKVELKSLTWCECSLLKISKKAVEEEKERFLLDSIPVEDCEVLMGPVKAKTRLPVEEFEAAIDEKIEGWDVAREELKREIREGFEEQYKCVFHDYSYIWWKNIKTGERFFSDQADVTLAAIVNELIIGKSQANEEEAKELFREFRGRDFPYPIFRRFILHAIAENWEKYGGLFWKMLDEDEDEEFFENPNYERELHVLLRENVKKFAKEEKGKVLAIVESGPRHLERAKEKNARMNYWRQTWLGSLKRDEFFRPWYEQYFERTSVVERDVMKDGEVRYGPGTSPKTAAKLAELPGKRLADYLKEYESEDLWDGPNVEGLAASLVEMVRGNPGKIAEDWEEYVGIPYVHMYHILWGERDAWDKGGGVPWEAVLKLMRAYISEEAFWNGGWEREDTKREATYGWVISEACELISVGTRSDSHAFDEELLPLAEKALQTIFEHLAELKRKDGEEEGSGLTHALNTPIGKATRALINVSLRKARRIKDKGRKPEWSDELKARYNWLLEQKVVEAYTFLGHFLGNFYYLDEAWAKEKVASVLAEKNRKLWATFWEGYLFTGNVYKNIFGDLQKHYEKGMDEAAETGEKPERLIEHIGVAYLQEYEALDGSLMGKMLESWKPEWLRHLATFFWRHRDIKEGPFPKRIVEFWRSCHDRLAKREPDEKESGLLRALGRLASFLPKLDEENHQWLMLSAPHVGMGTDSAFFIEYLNALKDRDGDRIQKGKWLGQVFLRLMEKSAPDFRREHIQEILAFLFETKDEEVRGLVDEVCERYAKQGNWMICRDLVEKYKQVEKDDDV